MDGVVLFFGVDMWFEIVYYGLASYYCFKAIQCEVVPRLLFCNLARQSAV